ncbi:hypothetical protein INT47_002197 [Mucor saturninus]|uniref:SH3 domain-containing protein n=1 Tax=Mucor saturninus TaxID=64648 RepID=A0A8H7V6F6_9FUNG|nr:hypothetical protein INT47_002197 [Mucor saturninus]
MSEYKIVTAHHPYEAQRDDEISFDQDEIIKVTDFSDPDWWVGKKKDGSLGFFPSNFVTPKDENNQQQQEEELKQDVETKDDVPVTEEPIVEEKKEKVDQVIGMARVMEDYAMQEPGEISLHRGGIINVYEVIDDQWSRGELNGKVGKYPSKYVEDIDMPGRPDLGQPQLSNESQKSPTDEEPPKGGFKLAAFGVKQGGIGSLLAGGFPGLKKTGGAKPEKTESVPPPPATAPVIPHPPAPVAPADATATAATAKDVEEKKDDVEEKKETTDAPSTIEAAPPAVPTVSKPTSSESAETQKPLGKAIVLHPYDAESEDELSLLRGEYVEILDRHIDDGWWKGKNEKGQSGVFPCNFVRELEDELVAPPTPTRARRNISSSRPSSVQSPVTARPISVQTPAQRPSSLSAAIPTASKPAAQPFSPSITEETKEEDAPIAEEEKASPAAEEQIPVDIETIDQAPPSAEPVAVEKVNSPPVPQRVASPAVEQVQPPLASPPVPERVTSPPVPERVVSPPAPERVTSPPVPERVISPPVPQRVTSPPVPERVQSPAIEKVQSPAIEKVESPAIEKVESPASESPVTLAQEESIKSPTEENLPERQVSVASEEEKSPAVIKEDPISDEEEKESGVETEKAEEETPLAVEEKTEAAVEEKEEEKNEFDSIPSGPKLTAPTRVRMGAGRARRSPQLHQEPSQTEVLQKELAEEPVEEKKSSPSPPAKPVKPIFAKFPTPFAVGGDVLSKSHLKPTQTRRLWDEKPAEETKTTEDAEESAPVRPAGVKNLASRFNFAGPPGGGGGNEVLETKLKNHTKNEIEKLKKEYDHLLKEERERVSSLEKTVLQLLERVNALEQQK